jgi:aspartyl-tRNA(Asn)/glutamyl-tRNA(Gln) amidotransferase subunit A
VQQAIRTAVGVLESLGCKVEEVTVPEERHVLGATAVIIGTEAMTYHASLLPQHAAKYAPDVRRRILAGGLLRGVDYVKAQRARRYLRHQVNAVLGQVDCLLATTLPIPAPAVGTTDVQLADRTENLRVALTMFTRLFNLSGNPVVSLPCGFTSTGLPLSMQVVGRAFDEATVLQIAHAYEQATPWHQRRPPGM